MRESQFGDHVMIEQPSLEDRIRAVEDRLEIYNLIAGHPPSADTGGGAYAEAVYTEDGIFDRGPGLAGAAGNKALGALLKSDAHQAAIAGGLAHFTGLPHITLNGDAAVVISYLQILTPKKSGEPVEVPNHGASRGYHIHRVVTNRWDLGAHRVGLEDQAPHHPPGRRLGRLARDFARGVRGVCLEHDPENAYPRT